MDFAKLLVVGIALFGILYLVSGGFEDFGWSLGGGYRFLPSSRNITPEEPIITAPKGDFVGNREVEDFRHIPLSTEAFTVSFTRETLPFVSLENVVIKNGIFGYSDRKITFSLTDDELNKLRDVKLSGEVDRTNVYGKLIVGLNDERIFSDIVEDGETFETTVNKSLFKNKNHFVLTAGSSGWRMWAPTVYMIKKLELESSFLGEVSQSFDFIVSKDEHPVTLGRIILNVDEIEGDGSLIVKVNENVVFNSTPTSRQWIDFKDIDIKIGENTVQMVSEEGTKFNIRDAEIIIFWNRQAQEILEIPLTLTSSQYRRLPGHIKFKIEKVFGNPTSLVVKIENPQGVQHSLVVQGILQEGKQISIELPKNYAGVGENKIILSVTGDGGYTITDFHLSL